MLKLRGKDPDPELYKFEAGSGSGINHSGCTTQILSVVIFQFFPPGSGSRSPALEAVNLYQIFTN